VPGNSRYKVKNEDTNIVKEKLQRKAKENFLNASFIQPSRQDLDTSPKKGRENEMQKSKNYITFTETEKPIFNENSNK